MKKIPRRAMSLLLSALFAVSLLTLSASADAGADGQDIPDDVLEKFEELFDYMESCMERELSSLNENDAEEGITAQSASACNHPGASSTYVGYSEYSLNPNRSHVKVVYTEVNCGICGHFITPDSSIEPHVYPYGRQYVSSNHSGPYSSHTHTYQSFCVCNHAKTETVPAGCSPGNCVDPYSLTPPALDS